MYINSPGNVITSGLASMTLWNISALTFYSLHGAGGVDGITAAYCGSCWKASFVAKCTDYTHQPNSGFQGQASDIEIHAKEILTCAGD